MLSKAKHNTFFSFTHVVFSVVVEVFRANDLTAMWGKKYRKLCGKGYRKAMWQSHRELWLQFDVAKLCSKGCWKLCIKLCLQFAEFNSQSIVFYFYCSLSLSPSLPLSL